MERDGLSNFVRYGKKTTKNTLVCFTWTDPSREPKVWYLNDVRVVCTENIIIVIHGAKKEIIVERKLDVWGFDVRRLDG